MPTELGRHLSMEEPQLFCAIRRLSLQLNTSGTYMTTICERAMAAKTVQAASTTSAPKRQMGEIRQSAPATGPPKSQPGGKLKFRGKHCEKAGHEQRCPNYQSPTWAVHSHRCFFS